MHDYIGYKLNDKVLIGYYVYLEENYSLCINKRREIFERNV